MTEVIGCNELRRNFDDRPLLVRLTSTTFDDVDEVDYTVNYRFEQMRLNSFTKQNWPHMSPLDPEKFAAAGFYYTGESDRVVCFECHLSMRDWQASDNPWTDHQRWNGKCRFIRSIPCGNVGIDEDPDKIPPWEPIRDVCGVYGMKVRPNTVVDAPINVYIETNSEMMDTIMFDDRRSKYLKYANYQKRLDTFENWPKAAYQTGEEMAEAGFFYTGKSDQVLCYYCGGGLKDWESHDIPIEEHVKWFSKCKYITKKMEELKKAQVHM